MSPFPSGSSPGRHLQVGYVVSGFPSPAKPSQSIFNLRAAQALNELVDLRVISLRAWKPGRSLVSTYEYEGLAVTRLCLPQVPRTDILNVRLYRWLGWPLLNGILSRCDVVHSSDVTGGSLIASSWARRARTRHVAQAVGSDINSTLPKLRNRPGIAGWETWLHGVSANSRALASLFQDLYPQVRNVRTIYRGVDLKRFHPNGPRSGPLAARSAVRFLFLGGFPSYPRLPHRSNTKGGETLLAAWREAETRFRAPFPSLLVAGHAADSEVVMRWRAGLQFPDRVDVLGMVPPDDVAAYLRSSDVVLQPSMEEGLPNGRDGGPPGRGRCSQAQSEGARGRVLRGDRLTLPPATSEGRRRHRRILDEGDGASEDG